MAWKEDLLYFKWIYFMFQIKFYKFTDVQIKLFKILYNTTVYTPLYLENKILTMKLTNREDLKFEMKGSYSQ